MRSRSLLIAGFALLFVVARILGLHFHVPAVAHGHGPQAHVVAHLHDHDAVERGTHLSGDGGEVDVHAAPALVKNGDATLLAAALATLVLGARRLAPARAARARPPPLRWPRSHRRAGLPPPAQAPPLAA